MINVSPLPSPHRDRRDREVARRHLFCQGQTQTVKSAIVPFMPDEEAIELKRERLAAETHEYFWNVCPELTADGSRRCSRCRRPSCETWLLNYGDWNLPLIERAKS